MSFVGVAKNCGKTTTLTMLMETRANGEAPLPALVSVGVDGEDRDALDGTKKPPIRVRSGQWVASAEGAIRRSSARVEYVESLDVSTPLGGVYVCRVREPGSMILAGLSRRADLVRAVEALDSRADGPVWIDGAYDRMAVADPVVADRVVVATGAVAGDDLEEVVGRTEGLVSRLRVPEITDPDDRSLIGNAVDQDRPWIEAGGPRPLGARSAVTGLDGLDEEGDNLEAVAVPGLVSNRVVQQLLGLGEDRRLLVPDPTVLQADDGPWEKLRTRWHVRVLKGVRPVAVSYNPTTPDGRGLEGRRLGRRLREVLDEPVIFDPLPNWPRCA